MQSPSPARERARTTHQSIPVFPPSPPTGCLPADPTYSFALVHFSEQKRPISPCFEKRVIAMHLEKGVTARKSALFIKSSSFAVESKSHGNDLSSQFQFHPNKWPGQKNASRANPNSSSLPLLQIDENHLISGRIPLPNCTSEYTRAPKPKMSQAHRFLRKNSNRRRAYTLKMRSDARIIPAWTSASHISLPFGGSCATRILS